MAYESVKNQIDAYIKANGVNLITGPVLNAVLTTMLDELGEGYAFQGVLDTTDTPSPAADIPQAWLASAGTYLGGSITVDEGELALIIHTSDGWSKETVYRGVQLSYEAIVAALGYTPADDADLAEKQDTIADLSDIRSGSALGSTSVQPADIENMVEAEPIGSIIPPVNPSEFATKEEVSQLAQEVNGGTEETTISTAQDVAVMRINAGNGNMTTSYSTDYSVCSFPVENGKTYKLKIPKLSNQFTAAYSFNNAPLVANGATSVLPDPIVKGLLENYETQITIDDSSYTYLDVCYETAYGKPTLTTTTHSEGLADKVESLDGRVASLEESVGDLSGDVETLSEKVETTEENVANLDSAVNGGTTITSIATSNSVANRRIAINTGNLTSSNATAYSVCAFPIEYGKTYHLIIPKLTNAYTYAYTFSNQDTLVAGERTTLPSSPVVGPLNNYGTDVSAPNANITFLLVCYETDGGVPTLTTETTTVGLVGDVADLKESVDVLQKGGKITIKKVSNTEIDLYIPNKENTAYLIHPIIRNGYTLDLSSEGGSSTMVCGDLYDPGDIVDTGNNAIVQGNLNFIFMVDADASGSGYENEGNYHVGSGGGHGLEVMDYALFFADGKQFSISEMTEDIVCSEFRFVQKSKCYAVDNTHNTGNAHNYPKLVNGEPIVTAEHYLDAVYEPGNIIKWRNQLNIKRDHIVFKQLHAGMLRPYSAHLSKMVVSDNKMSRCEWGMIEGSWTVTYIPESNSLLPNTIKADEVFVSGDSTISVYQRMFQDNGARYEKSQMMFAEYPSTNSFKSYFMPAIVSRGSASPETFNSGDILSVTNIREINI